MPECQLPGDRQTTLVNFVGFTQYFCSLLSPWLRYNVTNVDLE